MAFRPQVLSQIRDSYSNFSDFYKDMRSFFEVINVRFAIEEYGISLKCVAGNKLFSNASGYLLTDDSSYPFYLWLPSWLGRFYIDPVRIPPGTSVDDCKGQDAKLIAFIWTWLGINDAYVTDTEEPECWFGVADATGENPEETVYDIADKMWKYFRIERTCEGEVDGWLNGRFLRNKIGCNLTGQWFMRRVPLSGLTSYYQIGKLVVRPLGEKFYELSCGPQLREKAG